MKSIAMRHLFTGLMLASTMLFACSSYAEPAVNSRFLYLDGVITNRTIAPLQGAIERIVKSSGKEPVTIVIDSPGGSVVAGMSFINRMQAIKAKDIEINCYVLDVAASMAFQILTQCTNRYALPTSFLLWHGVRMGTSEPLTTAGAKAIAEDLQRMDDLVMFQLEESMELDRDTLEYHFQRETLWSGLGLHSADPQFLKLETAYPDLLSRLDKAVRSAPMTFSFFGFGGEQKLKGLIYIWANYDRYVGGTNGVGAAHPVSPNIEVIQ